MQEDLDAYQLGTPQQPAAGSIDYYRCRALLVGQEMLRRILILGIESDVAATERLYRKGTMHFGAAEVPPEPVIVKETVPADVVLPIAVPK